MSKPALVAKIAATKSIASPESLLEALKTAAGEWGLYHDIDAVAFTLLAQAIDSYRRYRHVAREQGEFQTVQTATGSRIIAHPALSLADKERAAAMRLMQELGFTSRARGSIIDIDD